MSAKENKHSSDLNSKDEEEKEEDTTNEVPDGGYGWVICFAGFIAHFLIDGITACFGIHLLSYQVYFDTSIANVSVANALRGAFLLLQGPFLGMLAKKYSCRHITMAGSLISGAAVLVSAYAPTLAVFRVFYGFFGGIGAGMIVIPTLLEIANYFDKKRAVAMGIATSGTGIGVLVMAPLARYLNDELGWSGAHYVYASLLLQCCVIGALMRPVQLRRRPNLAEKFGEMEEISDQRENKKEKYVEDERLHASEILLPPADPPKDKRSNRLQYSSLYNIPDFTPKQKTVSSDSSLPTNDSAILQANKQSHSQRIGYKMKSLTRTLMDQRVICLCIANLFGNIGYLVPIMFSSSRAIQYKVSGQNASLLVAVYGISNTIGRLLFGFVLSCIPKLSALSLLVIGLIVSGIALLLTPFCTTFPTMLLTLSIYGLFISTYVSLAPIMICDIFGVDNLSNIFGVVLLVQGVSLLAGPPITGLVYDLTGNYDNVFYIAGACMVVSVISHSFLYKSGCRKC